MVQQEKAVQHIQEAISLLLTYENAGNSLTQAVLSQLDLAYQALRPVSVTKSQVERKKP